MLFSDSYLTISNSAEDLYKEKGSKFLAFAFPVNSESEIKEKLGQLRKEHPSASHHCYAWRLGADKLAYRANDDGEPSHTAGKPILMQIQSNDLTNILIVVVRYFGGTLLGVGGLIHAYKQAAINVLQKTERLERFILFEYEAEFDFDSMSAMMRILRDVEANVSSAKYEEKNVVTFTVKKHFSEKLEERFKDLYTIKLRFLKME